MTSLFLSRHTPKNLFWKNSTGGSQRSQANELDAPKAVTASLIAGTLGKSALGHLQSRFTRKKGQTMDDILIIGGGPAGLCAGIMAAQAGRRVTICEPKPGDIDKACGEGLMPGAVDALHRLGVTKDDAPLSRDSLHR